MPQKGIEAITTLFAKIIGLLFDRHFELFIDPHLATLTCLSAILHNKEKTRRLSPTGLYRLLNWPYALNRIRHSIMRNVYPVRGKCTNQVIVQQTTIMAEMRCDHCGRIHDDI